MGCMMCGRGIHDECVNIKKKKCCCTTNESESVIVSKRGRSRTDEPIGDSAGRKRAAVDYPINKAMPCEWRNMVNCGGGKQPITGCLTGLQVHRHHGPDKVTSNNNLGNVHRICPTCHNTWHAKNDQFYDGKIWKSTEELPTPPLHNPRPGSLDEMVKGNK